VLRASRAGLLSTRYEITRDGIPICTWKPSAFIGGGTFELEGHRYEVARGGWTGRRYRLRDEDGRLVALADGVGRLTWTLEIFGEVFGESGGTSHTFERPSPFRRDQVLVVDGELAGAVHRTSAWWGEAEAELPGLPLPVQVFVLVSLLGVWDED
jgi:hypothetical protein